MTDLDEIRKALAAATEHTRDFGGAYGPLLANAPTWLAWCITEIERLRNGSVVRALAVTEQQRDAAHAENERLRAREVVWQQLEERFAVVCNEVGAWRACADQLDARLRLRAASPGNPDREALAVYERLKAGAGTASPE